MRANILTLLALISVLLEKSDWAYQTDKEHLVNLYQDIVELHLHIDQDEDATHVNED